MSARDACKFYAAGTCRNGAACRFSHDVSASTARESAGAAREVCKFYRGSAGCAFGDKCRYAHVDDGGEAVGRSGSYMRASAAAYAPSGEWARRASAWTEGGAGAEAEEAEEWGYVDENGCWVSFESEGEGAREFLAAQLPDEDELLGLTSDGGGDDAWGFYDEGGNWVELGGEAGQFLRTQEDAVR